LEIWQNELVNGYGRMPSGYLSLVDLREWRCLGML
jgi:hypothetical protein